MADTLKRNRTILQLKRLAAEAELLAIDLENYDTAKAYKPRLHSVKSLAGGLSDDI